MDPMGYKDPYEPIQDFMEYQPRVLLPLLRSLAKQESDNKNAEF